MVLVPFPLGSVYKYRIYANEDAASLKQIEQMFKYVVLQKPGVIVDSWSKLKKIEHTILEKFSKNNSLRNLTSFYGELFEFLEIFTKIIIWTWVFFKHCRVPTLKTKKNLLKKDARHLIVTWQRQLRETTEKHWKKRKKNKKWEKLKQQEQILLYFYFKKSIYFARKNILENLVYIATFVLQFFHVTVIENTVIKHQRPYRYALVLLTLYFDPKYLAID